MYSSLPAPHPSATQTWRIQKSLFVQFKKWHGNNWQQCQYVSSQAWVPMKTYKHIAQSMHKKRLRKGVTPIRPQTWTGKRLRLSKDILWIPPQQQHARTISEGKEWMTRHHHINTMEHPPGKPKHRTATQNQHIQSTQTQLKLPRLIRTYF